MNPLAFAWLSLTRAPLRAALGVAGIAAVGALLFDMLLLSRGLLVSFRDLLDASGYDVRVTATQAFPTLGPPIERVRETAAVLRSLPEIEAVIPLLYERAEAAAKGAESRPITLIGSEGGQRRAWTLLRGEDIAAAGPVQEASPGARGHRISRRAEGDTSGLPPVVVNRALAEAFGLEPGSLLLLRGASSAGPSAAPEVEARVAGVAEFPFDSLGELTVLATLPVMAAILGRAYIDDAEILLVASRRPHGSEAAVRAIRRARPDLHPFSNEKFIERFARSDFSYFQQISLVLSSVTLFFAFLLVTTLLTVSVNQRLGEVAALRALGFSRGRLALDLLLESAILAGMGGLLALPIGAGLARVLDGILRDMPGLPLRLHFFVFEPRAVLLQCALLGLVTVLAAVYPIAIAMRLPIAATLRKETVS